MPEYRLNITGYQKFFIGVLIIIVLGISAYLVWPIAQLRETDILVPVVHKNLPTGLTTTPPLVKSIEFRIKGKKSVINNLSQENLTYILDLSGVDIGVVSIPIDRKQLPFPKGIKVLNAAPSFVTVKIEKEIKKILPVSISFSGKPAKGFDVAKAAATPPSVMIKGPETLLEALAKIYTKPIDINGVSEPFKKEVTLDLKEGLTVISSNKLILVTVDITEKTGKKVITHIPVSGKGTSLPFNIQPPDVNIEISGPVTKIENLDKEKEINAYVDLDGLVPGTYKRQAVISLPVDFTITGITPETFMVTINKK